MVSVRLNDAIDRCEGVGEGRKGVNHDAIVLGLSRYLDSQDREVWGRAGRGEEREGVVRLSPGTFHNLVVKQEDGLSS